jgi:uncharacterized protein (TIRG00374 family)
MIKKLLVILKPTLPLLIGLFLVYYSYNNTSPQDRISILNSILMADYKYIFLGIFMGILSHLSRAVRWKYLLNPIGYKISFSNSIMSIMASYLGNLGIPRSGEILRATSLYAYENVPFEKGFGTIVTERIIDVIILFACIVLGIYLSPELWNTKSWKFNFNYDSIQILIGFLIILFIIFFLIKKFSIKNKIYDFFSGLKKGLMSITIMKKKKKFVLHTFFIWMMYFFMTYIIKFSLPETATLEFGPLFIAFVAGAIALSTTKVGIGVYPLAIAAVLSQYNVSYEIALALGWIIWTSQSIMILFFGSLSFIFLPILNKK